MCEYVDICAKYPGEVVIETEGTGILSLKITLVSYFVFLET